MKNINRTPARALEEDFSVRRKSYEKLIGIGRYLALEHIFH